MKVKSAIYPVIFAVLLLSILFSCKKGSNEPTDKEPVYVKNDSINQNVFNVNSNEATLKSDSAKLSQGIYELQFSSTPLKFKAGDIIVGQDNQGYLRKVISATISGNIVTLQTSQATLENLYKDAKIRFQLNLSNKKNANANNAIFRESKINFIEKGVNVNSNGMSYDFSNTTIYQNGPLTFKITNGNVKFEPNFIFDIDIGFFKVKKIAFYADNADLNINCDVNLNAAQKIKLANYSVKLADIDAIYTVGLITVVVNTKLMARLTADVNSELNVNTGFINNYKITLGAIYDNSIWTGKYGLTPTFTPKPVDMSGSVQFGQSLTITPDVSVRLYGVAGPYCIPEMYEQFNANVASPSLDWDALLKVGVNTTVGANVTIFGETLAAYSKTYNAEKELWNAPDSIIKISGDNQSGRANQALAQPLKIKVTDNLNNALKNVVVYFNVVQGGGSVSNTSIKSDVNGFAETIWTLGGGAINEVQVKVKKSDGTDISSSPLSFTSLFSIPVLATTTVTNITATTAISGGNITNDGGATITSRGVCWSTSQTPTTGNNKTTDGSGINTFTSNLTNLTADATYYVRAYAINSVGTSYGNQVTFTTSQTIALPTLTTNSITSITQTTANGDGNVTSDGGVAVTARGMCWSTSQNPTTANYKTVDGVGVGSFTSNINGLTANTTYYVRAYATNSAGTAYGNQISFKTTSSGGTSTVTDIDGNVYNTVTIGTQVWMVENLKTTKYNDGTSIPNVTDNTAWGNLATPGYCWYNNDPSSYENTYGALYNWFTANTGKLAPPGWHVPTDAEWTTLTTYLGGESVAGGKLKETGTNHWSPPNTGATNETGFTALSGGWRDGASGSFASIGNYGAWLTSTFKTNPWSFFPCMSYNSSGVTSVSGGKQNGFSVRCVKD